MTSSYFTFGQDHAQRLNDVTYDADCVIHIVSEDPRGTMFRSFGPKWSMQYDTPPNMKHFPRGIFEHPENPNSLPN